MRLVTRVENNTFVFETVPFDIGIFDSVSRYLVNYQVLWLLKRFENLKLRLLLNLFFFHNYILGCGRRWLCNVLSSLASLRFLRLFLRTFRLFCLRTLLISFIFLSFNRSGRFIGAKQLLLSLLLHHRC